jgi:hypothetical protein
MAAVDPALASAASECKIGSGVLDILAPVFGRDCKLFEVEQAHPASKLAG